MKIYKLLVPGAAFLAALSLASAAEITVTGYTDGAFNGTPGNSNVTGSVSFLGLTYTDSTFSGSTSGGFLSIGNVAGTPNVDNLGSFTLAATPATYGGNTFTLRTTFTAPTVIAGSNTTLFNATLTGSVSGSDTGGVFIDFNNTPVNYTFSNTTGGQTTTGSFTFFPNDVSLIAGGSGVALTGTITGGQQTAGVPDGGTTAGLMGLALAGLVALRRKLR